MSTSVIAAVNDMAADEGMKDKPEHILRDSVWIAEVDYDRSWEWEFYVGQLTVRQGDSVKQEKLGLMAGG